jgi:molybdenum cofactor cytidylyltransferase
MGKHQKIGCVVMAAGNARRYGSNKLSAQFRGKSLIHRALEAIPADLFAKIVVVTQYPEVAALAEAFQFTAVYNHRPAAGVSHTVSLGLAQLRDCDGAMFLVADQPMLRQESISALIALWLEHPQKIAALAHHGVRGNPCIFPAAYYPELLHLEGDRGGSSVICRHEEDLLLLEAGAQELLDIDTPEALKRWEQS